MLSGAPNNRLERTASALARARRKRAARLCALAPRRKRRRAAAQPERYAALNGHRSANAGGPFIPTRDSLPSVVGCRRRYRLGSNRG